MNGAPKVTVAGAGAFGLASALALADAGARVTVCDPTLGAGSASAVAGGMIAPAFEAALDPEARPHLDLLLAARNEWAGLSGRAGVALDRSGAMAVGEPGWLAKVAGALRGLGLPPAELTGPSVHALAPGLSPEVETAVLTREDWRVDARNAMAALRRACEGAGVAFEAREVLDLDGSDHLLIATGAARGLEALEPRLAALSAIKGQIVRAALPGASHVILRSEACYLSPAEDGLAVGATMEAGRSDTAVDPATVERLTAAGARLVPALAQAPRQGFAGVRAATADGLPMVGPGTAPGVVLALGARRNGWLLAPLVGRIAAACVTGRDPGPYARALDPARF